MKSSSTCKISLAGFDIALLRHTFDYMKRHIKYIGWTW